MAVGKTAMHVKTIHLRIETQVFAIIILWVGKVDALIVLLPLLATATAGGLALLSTFAHLAPSAIINLSAVRLSVRLSGVNFC